MFFLELVRSLKAYRLYDSVSNKIIVSKDVVFEEDNNWDWGKSHKEVTLTDWN